MCAEPDQEVRWMGAIQAQNLPAAINAIAVRVSPLSKLTVDDVEQAIVDRKIVRTWPMRGTLHLVPAFDEMLCGYKDKTATFGSTDIKSTILKNGIIQPMIITENQTVGIWKQVVKKERIIIEAHLFRKISALEKEKIKEKAIEQGYFLNKHATVHFL